jgi:hypothetical protein
MIFLAVVLHSRRTGVVNGTYELTDHGTLIGYLTEEEYLRLTNYDAKFFSSSWLMFYAASAAYLLHLREVATAGFREIHLAP